MAENYLFKDDQISIDPSLIIVSGATYSVSSIGSVKVSHKEGGYGFGAILCFIVSSICLLFCAAAISSKSSNGAIISGTMCLLFFVSAMSAKSSGHYSLMFSTSSGEKPVLTTANGEYINGLKENIDLAISMNGRTPIAEQSDKTMDCPRCAETIKRAAKVCRFCGHEFSQNLEGKNE